MTKDQTSQSPKKSLGQNFLVNTKAIQQIADFVVPETPLLLEIGPGKGALSLLLHRRCQKFCLLEKDDHFAKVIGTSLFLDGSRNHTVFHGDALDFDWARIWSETDSPKNTPLTVAANLPYNVATEILFRLLKLWERIPKMILMFQKEVGMRIASNPGKSSYGILSVACQNRFKIEIQQILKPESFWPKPKVDSVVVELHRREAPLVLFSNEQEESNFHSLVKVCFSHKRKTLENSLGQELKRIPWSNAKNKQELTEKLKAIQIDGKRRAETLSVEEFGKLFFHLSEKK